MRSASIPVEHAPTPSSALKARFAAWAAVVLAVMAGPWWSMAGQTIVDVAWSLAGLTIMLVLLRSTPADAIRLPRWVSVIVLAAGMIWLLVAHDRPAPIAGMLLGLVVGASIHRSGGERRNDGSPWIAGAFAWHPMLWLLPETQEWASASFPVRPAIWVVAMALVIVAMWRLERRRGARPRTEWIGWLAWIAAGATTVMLVMRWPPPP